MNLITLATLLSSICCQEAVIHSDRGPISVNSRYNQCRNSWGKAYGISTQNGDKIILYSSEDCGSGYYAWGVGNYKFDRPYRFQSYKILSSGGKSSWGDEKVGSSSGQGFGGEDVGDPSFYQGPNYYHNSWWGIW